MAKVADKEFSITLKRLVELLESEDEDDYGILKPSEYAFKTVMNWVVEVYELMGSSFPKASASTDHEGSIILAWKNLESNRQVRMFCPFSPNKQAYIYHDTSDEYAVDYAVSALTLCNWLQWLKHSRLVWQT